MMLCRACNFEVDDLFVSLGSLPLANSYLTEEGLKLMEPYYPLELYVCTNCYLVQLDEFESPQRLFSDYSYFSSFSRSWLEHASAYVEKMTKRFNINKESHVVEIASNDGYLLQYFLAKGVEVLGIEPAKNVASVAIEKGIPTETVFFGEDTAKRLLEEGKGANLIVGNNVLAHVPDINDFVKGLKILLKPGGVITMEFPHLMRLMENTQFDTIYHEHFSYLSLLSAERIFVSHALRVFDVDEIPTHGGSLRIYARHEEDDSMVQTQSVNELKEIEKTFGLKDMKCYRSFSSKVEALKRDLLTFLINIKSEGKTIVGYGAPAKGNTLLNYCGIGTDFLDYTVDMSPHKQGRFLPGSRIPIFSPDKIMETKPDYIIILPWNIKDEIMEQMSYVRDWGAKFVVSVPDVEVFE